MPECLTFAFHRQAHAQPCGHCPACLATASIEPPPFVQPAPVEPVEKPVENMPADMPATVEVVAKPGGWHDLIVNGEVVDTVRGKAAAESRRAELAAIPAAQGTATFEATMAINRGDHNGTG